MRFIFLRLFFGDRAQGGRCFRTPCPKTTVLIVNGVGHFCQRQRPDPAKGPVQGYDPLSDSAQIGPPPDPPWDPRQPVPHREAQGREAINKPIISQILNGKHATNTLKPKKTIKKGNKPRALPRTNCSIAMGGPGSRGLTVRRV